MRRTILCVSDHNDNVSNEPYLQEDAGMVSAKNRPIIQPVVTCLGVSAAYQAAALAADGDGRLVTIEGYEELAAQARVVWDRLGLRNVDGHWLASSWQPASSISAPKGT